MGQYQSEKLTRKREIPPAKEGAMGLEKRAGKRGTEKPEKERAKNGKAGKGKNPPKGAFGRMGSRI